MEKLAFIDNRSEMKIIRNKSKIISKFDIEDYHTIFDYDLEESLNQYILNLEKYNVEVSPEDPIFIEYSEEKENKYLYLKNDPINELLYVPVGNGHINQKPYWDTLSNNEKVLKGCGIFKSMFTCPDHVKESAKPIPQTCHSMKCSCPQCHESWLKDTEERLSEEIISKIKTLKTLNSRLQVYHYTLSPPQQYAKSELQKDRVLTDRMYFGNSARFLNKGKFGLEKLRYQAIEIMKNYSVQDSLLGGYIIFHSHRETKQSKMKNKICKQKYKKSLPYELREFYESPHFHIFGIVTMDFKKYLSEDSRSLYSETGGWVFKMMDNDRSGYKSIKKTISYELSHSSFLRNHSNKGKGKYEKIPSVNGSLTKTVKNYDVIYDKQKNIIDVIESEKQITLKSSVENIKYSQHNINRSLKTIFHFGCFHHSFIKSVENGFKKKILCKCCEEQGIEQSLLQLDNLCIERTLTGCKIHKIAINDKKNYKKPSKNSLKNGKTTPYKDYSKNYQYLFTTKQLEKKVYRFYSFLKPKKLFSLIQKNINSLLFFNSNKSEIIQTEIINRFFNRLPERYIRSLSAYHSGNTFNHKPYKRYKESELKYELLGQFYYYKNNIKVEDFGKYNTTQRYHNKNYKFTKHIFTQTQDYFE